MTSDGGLASFQRRMRAIPDRVKAAARAEMARQADAMVALMRALVPVDEGKLRDSIGWTWGNTAPAGAAVFASAGAGDMAITIYAGNESTMVTNARGVQFQNALIQEFGAKGRPGRPYFRIVGRIQGRKFRAGLGRAISRAIREGA